ncbi:MAG TPA: alpha/beta fold hydrolase, partial [Longimicrobiales bacterium]|nr:alpha/beta fold hydrolase [Longimicrobiales bacterium]
RGAGGGGMKPSVERERPTGRRPWTVRRLLILAALSLAALPTAATADRGTLAPGPAARSRSGAEPMEGRSDRTGSLGVLRHPVLLVPGWGDGREQLLPLRRRFLEAGWKKGDVDVVQFRDPVGSNVAHAEELATTVDRFLERTGAGQVDVVAHSMGGLAVRRYLLDGGNVRVRRVAFLATPHRGTLSARLAWGEGAREMERGSRFLLDLIRARAVPRGVEAITVRTPLDLHVVPNESATLPGIPNLEVCCPTHAGLLDDDATFELVERFLERR